MTDEELIDQMVGDVFRPMRRLMRRPMTSEESDIMIRLNLAPAPLITSLYDDMIEKGQAVKAASLRASSFTMRIENKVILFISLIAEAPADIVTYLNFAVWCAREEGHDELTWDTFVWRVCPNGFLTRQDLDTLFDAAKYDNGRNGLDSRAVIEFLNSPKVAANA